MNAIAHPSRIHLAAIAALAVAGIALGWNKGQLPIREMPHSAATFSPRVENPKHPSLPDQQLAADLALYCEMVHAVRCGANYYDAGREKIPQYGFPIASPLNWRLPTYAWLFSLSPNLCLIQLTLITLSIAALALAFTALSRTSSVGFAAITTFLLFGVVRWSIDGYAFLAQEPWAAALLLISLAATSLAEQRRREGAKERQREASLIRSITLSFPPSLGLSVNPWACLAFTAGIAALLFRELALPYCGIAFLFAAFNRRWLETAAWAAGIALFFAYFAWHVTQVHAQLAGVEVAASAGLSQWLRFGGLDFVLLTTRMNSLLFAAPAFLLWLYLLASLIGLARRADETSQLACLAALAYLLAFALLGRPENFYWGLLPAPLLAWGFADGVRPLAKGVTAILARRPCSRLDSAGVMAIGPASR